MKKILIAGTIALLAAAEAQATTTYFYGTSDADTIVVGRTINGGGWPIYAACVDGNWDYGNQVTGSSDSVYVYGYGGADSIRIREKDDVFCCGTVCKWFYRMDWAYSCPGYLVVYGGDGNDRIFGAQCVEWIAGDNGNDTIFGGDGDDILLGNAGNDCISDTSLWYLACGADTDSKTDPRPWYGDCENTVSYCFVY